MIFNSHLFVVERLRSVADGIWTPNLPLAGELYNQLRHRHGQLISNEIMMTIDAVLHIQLKGTKDQIRW